MSVPTPRLRPRPLVVALAAGLIASVAGGAALIAQSKRDFNVVARKYSFSVNGGGGEIRVQQGDRVTITFSSDDIPHSFTIDDYRIDRRAEPGKPVTFGFVADRARPEGFEIRCTLSIAAAIARRSATEGWRW
jgi:heme/copper-type cytochrome/quinol oxidase subunit 2